MVKKEYQSPSGGLNEKGRQYFKNKEGANLKPPVTQKNVDPESKSGKRKKSFCARMSGVKGPMRNEKGEPTRKALALKKWRCG